MILLFLLILLLAIAWGLADSQLSAPIEREQHPVVASKQAAAPAPIAAPPAPDPPADAPAPTGEGEGDGQDKPVPAADPGDLPAKPDAAQ